MNNYMAPVTSELGVAERVGFEPTVPLPRRMLSKHVDSSTLAPLRNNSRKMDLSMRSQERQGAGLTVALRFSILRKSRGGVENEGHCRTAHRGGTAHRRPSFAAISC